MKKNNVLNVTDLRNPDINRKNVKKQSKNSYPPISFYANTKKAWESWPSFLDELVEDDSNLPSQLIHSFREDIVLIDNFLFGLRKLLKHHTQSCLPYSTTISSICDKFDYPDCDIVKFPNRFTYDSLRLLIGYFEDYKQQIIAMIDHLEPLCNTSNTDDDELPF